MREPENNEAAGTAIPAASMNPTSYERASAMNMLANRDNFNGIVISQRNGVLMASSREVAQNFGKLHKNVLQSIKNMECSEDFARLNFQPSEYVDATGRSLPQMLMTRDGFTFLVMGFTGKEAAAWKERYIVAFNAMEARLRQSSQIDLSDPAQLVPLLTSYAQRTQIAEAKVAVMSPKAEAFDVLDASEGSVCLRIAAKLLDVQEKKFKTWLEYHRWAFRQNGIGPWQAYADKRSIGYLEHKPHTFFDQKLGENRTTAQIMFTPKGLARLASIFAKEGKPA